MRRVKRGAWLALLAAAVFVPVGCADGAANALAERAQGRWRCEQGEDERWLPFEVAVGPGTFTWYAPDGQVQAESTWSLDGSELTLGLLNPVGDEWAMTGVEEGADEITASIRPGDPQTVQVGVGSEDEVTFREATPGSVIWTCRRLR